MNRYLRLFLYFLRFSFSRAMEFRIDFFFRIVMDLVYYAINILFFKVVFLHTGLLGGWNEQQMMIFVAAFLVIDAINMTLFANNLWWLSAFVNKGDLDYYLVRPVSPLFFLSLRDFAANSFINLLMACGLLVWALVRYDVALSAGKILLFIILLLNGAYLRYVVRMITIIPVFWLQSVEGFEYLFFHLNRFIERPDRIFTGAMRVVLTTALPFLLMASYPARILMEPFQWKIFGTIIVVTILFSIVLGLFWKMGLRAYSSASS